MHLRIEATAKKQQKTPKNLTQINIIYSYY